MWTPEGNNIQLRLDDNINLEDLDFLDEIELNQNTVATGNNIQLRLDDNINLEDLDFLDEIELNQNTVATESNPSEDVPVSQEDPSDSTQLFDLIEFITSESNNLNEPIVEPEVESKVESNVELKVEPKVEPKVKPKVKPKIKPKAKPKIKPKAKPNAKSFASLAISGSDPNVASHGLPPVYNEIPDQNLLVSSSGTHTAYRKPEELNWPIASIQPNFHNPTNYVQPNTFVQRQALLPITQPEQFTYPDFSYLYTTNKPVLVLCENEDYTAIQPLATYTPVLQQTQDLENVNPLHAAPRPTQGMGLYGQNLRLLAPRNPVIAAAPGAYLWTTAEAAAQQNSQYTLATTTRDVSGELEEYLIKRQQQVKTCRCEKSKCLKLQCECFLRSVFCNESCKCNNCFNNLAHENERKEVVKTALARNPETFQKKTVKSGTKHKGSCKCKKGCLQNYCECQSANILCSRNCKCVNCKNRDTVDELDEDDPTELYDENNSSNSNFDDQNEEKMPVGLMSLFTDDVINAVCNCMLLKAAMCPGSKNEQLIAVMQEFSKCMIDIQDAAYDQIVARNNKNKIRIKNSKKKIKKKKPIKKKKKKKRRIK